MESTNDRVIAIREALSQLLARTEARDAAMDDPTGDGSGDGSRPPDGDDYNDLCQDVRYTLGLLLVVPAPGPRPGPQAQTPALACGCPNEGQEVVGLTNGAEVCRACFEAGADESSTQG